MEFKNLTESIKVHFDQMAKNNDLFIVDADRQEIYDRYLASFPEGSNPIWRTRHEYDCNSCKNFIRDIGHVVAIVDGKCVTIWDVNVADPIMQTVANSMAEYIRSLPIKNIFLHYQSKVGNPSNVIQLEDKSMVTFSHFNAVVPSGFVSNDRDSIWGKTNGDVAMYCRGLETITDSAIDTVIELIEQDSIYRGAEHKNAVVIFKTLKNEFDKLTDSKQKNMFIWGTFKVGASRIRNTVIGTLLTDISEGVDLNVAVASFESKVAPSNYKRTTALITQGMIDQAVKTIRNLGVEDALQRRFAKLSDVSVNNVLYASADVISVMKDPLTSMLATEVKPQAVKNFDKVDEISMEDFISKVIPKSTSIEVMLENRHKANFLSLIAPENPTAKNILKWNNNFSWGYSGNVTDSVKERVKSAGGTVEGDLRVSLSWFNHDDLDLHMIEPNGNEIHFPNKGHRHSSSGMLDVDMNAGSGSTREPVENIIYTDKTKMPHGRYRVIINNYAKRESIDVGFQIDVEFDGVVHKFSYNDAVRDGENIPFLDVFWDGKNFTLSKEGETNTKSVEIWGINTNTFIPVQAVSLSPNFWDGQENGNKHYFFFLSGCKSDEPTRGLYNEFLSNELTPHRKVFEVLGDKMKCQPSDEQLSGIGFSSTKREELVVKVQGEFTRMLKIKF